MKRFWEVVVVVVVIIAGLFFFFPRKYTYNLFPPAQNGTASENGSNSPAASTPQTVSSSNGMAAVTAGSNEIASRVTSPNPVPGPTAGTNEEPVLPPLTVLDQARVALGNYRSAFSQNPVGNNAEITAALMGKNPRQINFIADSGVRVNEKGEMVDVYGTPFFFHQISGQEMEIRSAGEDKILWTFDDLVTK
ncbi:MAG TPA: hypothetical protein VH597_16815 [Verrucomicrobiae bacterium]|jgi:hypothetical protein|nr:hypothetical protein [Verrucomicrobiae bacterium]